MGFGSARHSDQSMAVVTQIIFGAACILGIWLPVYGYQVAVKGIHAGVSDE
jgi:hypothetical protein